MKRAHCSITTNYRSSQRILNEADVLIRNNLQRLAQQSHPNPLHASSDVASFDQNILVLSL